MDPTAYLRLAFVGIAICLTGCAGAPHISLSNNVRSELKSVSVSESVQIPDTLFFFGANQAMFGAIGGGLGGVLGETILDDKTLLKNLLKTNNIAVDKMFRTQLETDLKKSRLFNVVDTGGDAYFKIAITQYGLFKRAAFDAALRPAIWADVALVKSDNSVLWQKSVAPRGFENRIPAHDFSYYQAHPQALRESFEQLISILTTELLADLQP